MYQKNFSGALVEIGVMFGGHPAGDWLEQRTARCSTGTPSTSTSAGTACSPSCSSSCSIVTAPFGLSGCAVSPFLKA